MIRRRTFTAAALASLGVAPAVRAQAYPARPITVIVPFAAGGPTDVLARILTQRMSQTLGQTLVVDNTAGAGGTIAATKASRAPGDGYTLLFSHMGVQAVNIALYKTLQYDSQKDFLPVGLGGTNPMVLVVKKDFPAQNFAEFMAYVKANEPKISYGMAGIGSASHLGGLMLNHMMGTKVQEIPYRGTGPALNDLVAGQFDWMVDQAINVLQQIRAGNIRALGVSSLTRLEQLPDVPTIDEAGLKGYEVSIWNAFFAPKKTPAAVIAKLNGALVEALADPTIVARLTELAVAPPGKAEQTPEALAAQLKGSIEKWVPVIKSAGVEPQ
jgi:tripartite-type tricarboxylate transporter receptor subunit TctC